MVQACYDPGLLPGLTGKGKEPMGIRPVDALADTGYRCDLGLLETTTVETCVAIQKSTRGQPDFPLFCGGD